MIEQATLADWTFPYCPTLPEWSLDWEALQAHFSWLRDMDGVPQNPLYHAEGDVLIHTGMVAEALTNLPEWQKLPPLERSLLFAAALLHDVAKPRCTRVEPEGHITSKGHAHQGEIMTRRILWTNPTLALPLTYREQVASLVRFHGLPLQFMDKAHPERAVVAASQSVRLDQVALLAEADVRGRICADQAELLERVELFRLFCQELDCYTGPRTFPSNHSRFVYFHSEHPDLSYEAYDDTLFEVVLMSGLPAAGKDSWIATHLADWPLVSLDAIRKEMNISPGDGQGRVIQEAKERARSLMRRQTSFVWNATNLTRQLRQQLIDSFVAYGARVRLIYVDAPHKAQLQRNRKRQACVPEEVIDDMLSKLEVPDQTEAHTVIWHTNE